jgi:hypothetical protein
VRSSYYRSTTSRIDIILTRIRTEIDEFVISIWKWSVLFYNSLSFVYIKEPISLLVDRPSRVLERSFPTVFLSRLITIKVQPNLVKVSLFLLAAVPFSFSAQ